MKKVIYLLILMLPFPVFADLNENWKRDAIKAVEKVPKMYASYIDEAAWKYEVSHSFITTVIVVESLGEVNAVSSSGAKCLMQTKDFIGKEVGMPGNSCNPRESIMRGTAYLARMRDVYGYDWVEGMAVAYSDGWKRTKRYNVKKILNHPYVEKMNFVLKHL